MNRNTEWEGSYLLLHYALATMIVSAKIRLTFSSVLCCFFGDYQSVSVLLNVPVKVIVLQSKKTVYLLHKQLRVSAIERRYHQAVYKNKMKILAVV